MIDFLRNLPNWVKGILFLSISIIVAAVIISQNNSPQYVHDPLKQTASPKYTQVGLTVKNPQKEPLDDVRVEFNFKGAPPNKLTDSNGYVQIKLPERDDIKVYLSKKEYKRKNYTLNLLTDPDRNIEIELEQEHSSSKSQPPEKPTSSKNQSYPVNQTINGSGNIQSIGDNNQINK